MSEDELTLEQVVDRFLQRLAKFSDEERKTSIDRIHAAYCQGCGQVQHKTGRQCPCESATVSAVVKERLRIRRAIRDEIRPALDREKCDGGYNCCGCSTYEQIVEDIERLVRDSPVLKSSFSSDGDERFADLCPTHKLPLRAWQRVGKLECPHPACFFTIQHSCENEGTTCICDFEDGTLEIPCEACGVDYLPFVGQSAPFVCELCRPSAAITTP